MVRPIEIVFPFFQINGRVDAADVARFAPYFNEALGPGGCFDYDNDGSVGPGDFSIFERDGE